MVKYPGSSNCLGFLRVGCWNVRSLVEMDGGIKTATVRPKGHPVHVDRKIKFPVQELDRFHMSIVCISETKLFGDDVYEVDGFTVLHSGRSIPQSGDAVQRGEGVAIVLDPLMATSWRDSGGKWSAISSRIVSARLQLCLNDSTKLDVTIVSVYAPTHQASVEMKDQFFDDLQAVISSTPPDDLLLVMGNFNARVGCGGDTDPSWLGVRGMFGVGRLNENGEHLLGFCALNGLYVMNTMFAKRRIHQYTWQHPGTKIWHCIDYVLMRHSQRCYCTDAMVFRSAECWTDHRLVCATLRFLPAFRRQISCRRGQFNVGPLHDGEFVQNFVSRVTQLLGDVWDGEADGQTQWSVIRDRMLQT